jgi:hypothetical protein
LGSVDAALYTYSLVYPRRGSLSNFLFSAARFFRLRSLSCKSNACEADTVRLLLLPIQRNRGARLYEVLGRRHVPRPRSSDNSRSGRAREESRSVAELDAHAHFAGHQQGEKRRDCGNRHHLQEERRTPARTRATVVDSAELSVHARTHTCTLSLSHTLSQSLTQNHSYTRTHSLTWCIHGHIRRHISIDVRTLVRNTCSKEHM